jgi:pyruvate formate lyase activating enzyme
MIGRECTVGELVADVMKEKRYYQGSKGGVTVSGGEPGMQPEFLLALVRELKKEGVHIALETSGICDYRVYESALPYIDLFLYDCKETDPALHKKFTGVDHKPILENLRRLYKAKAAILLRCPVVKGLNDREDHFRNLAALSQELPDLVGIEILPYHKLGASKAEHMGLESQKEYEQVPRLESDKWTEAVRSFGGKIYAV